MTKKIILNKAQRYLLQYIADSILKDHLYWTGGTALSECYFQHRLSTDIDLFSQELIDDISLQIFIKDLKKSLKIKKIFAQQKMNRRIYDLDGLKLEIVYFPFKNIRKHSLHYGVKTDSLEDIATNKTLALYQRNDPKDIFDLYFIFKKTPLTRRKLLKNVEKKFGEILEESLFQAKCQQALGKLQTLKPLTIEPTIIPKIETYFQKEDKKYLLSILF